MASGAMVCFSVLALLTLLSTSSASSSHGTQNERVTFQHIRSHYTAKFDLSHLLLQSEVKNTSLRMTLSSTAPIGFTVSKCHQTVFQSQKKIDYADFYFEHVWLDRLKTLNDASCEMDQPNLFQIEIDPSAPCNGILVFRLHNDENHAQDHTDNPMSQFKINQEAKTTKTYKSIMPKAIEIALNEKIDSVRYAMQLASNISTPVQMQIGKCDIHAMNPVLIDQPVINMTGYLLDQMNLFTHMRCQKDSSAGFDTYITTFAPTTGTFAFALMDLRGQEVQENPQNPIEFSVSLKIFVGVIVLLVVAFVIIYKSGTRRIVRVWQDRFDVQWSSNPPVIDVPQPTDEDLERMGYGDLKANI